MHWAVLPQVGHDPRTPANGKSQDNNVRGTQAGASKDYQDTLHSSVKVRRLQDRIGRLWPPAITSSSPRESHEGKRKEKRKADMVTGTRGETLLRQMIDVPSPMEQACQIPSQLLGGQVNSLKAGTLGRSEGVTHYLPAVCLPNPQEAVCPSVTHPCFSPWLPISASASTHLWAHLYTSAPF